MKNIESIEIIEAIFGKLEPNDIITNILEKIKMKDIDLSDKGMRRPFDIKFPKSFERNFFFYWKYNLLDSAIKECFDNIKTIETKLDDIMMDSEEEKVLLDEKRQLVIRIVRMRVKQMMTMNRQGINGKC